MTTTYQQCTRCVMDTSDPLIVFDAQGVCSHCHEFDNFYRPRWFPNAEGATKLAAIAATIRQAGKHQDYDCILGLSGGVDSSYLALKIKELGLRPLVMHVDCGWNSELAVHNIERIVKYCGYDLHTHVVDWEEVKDLQLAYLKSGVSNQDAPQDHAFFAALYRFATQHNVRYVISGGNIATEAIFPKGWHGNAMDLRNLHAIHRRFGKNPLKTFPTASFFDQYVYYPFIKKMRVVRPLNYLPYHREDAIAELKEKVGYTEYGRKHGESVFTKFFQNYYLIARFGMDKRRPHFSSMVHSGQMTREQALAELAQPAYDANQLEEDTDYFCKKLSLSRPEFEALLTAPTHDWLEYPNSQSLLRMFKRMQALAAQWLGIRVRVYS